MNDSDGITNAAPTGGAELECPVCGRGILTRRHCKTLCEQCGYVESCEDNFIPTQAAPAESSTEPSSRRSS